MYYRKLPWFISSGRASPLDAVSRVSPSQFDIPVVQIVHDCPVNFLAVHGQFFGIKPAIIDINCSPIIPAFFDWCCYSHHTPH